MRRRRFLQTAATGAAWWVARRALADTTLPRGARAERGHLAAALSRAGATHRPLLVIVIPASDRGKHERGEALGDFIEHGSDDALSPFAYAELVCAPADELRAVTAIEGEPLFVRLDASGAPGVAAADYPSRGPARRAAIAERLASLIPPQAHLAMNGDGRRIALALRKRAPTGSHWARRASCGGVLVEEWADYRIDSCDMVVPQDRFLWFYGRP